MSDKSAFRSGIIDKAALARADDVLAKNGVKVDPDVLQQAIDAAVTPVPDQDDIPVSIGMARAGREFWVANPSASPNVLVPGIYRAMERKRREEDPPP